MRSIAWHHLTIDVEEFFHPTALEPWVPKSTWESWPRRAPRLVERILAHLEEERVRATFFVLGWLAEREPGLIHAISEAGHEIASHGWDHRRVFTLSPGEFREDVRRTNQLLQELAGERVVGYRAPSFSILPGLEWALDALLEEGILYDSSMFPVRVHPGYGYPSAKRDPHEIQRAGGNIWEVPPATLRIAGLNIPAAGGAYLRFFTSLFVDQALKAAASRNQPGTVYLHPWEVDEEMPRFRAPVLTQLRMRVGRKKMLDRLRGLTRRFQFRPIRDTIEFLRSSE